MWSVSIRLPRKSKTPTRWLGRFGFATIVIVLIGHVYLESPRFLARAILQNQMSFQPISVEVQSPSGQRLLSNDEAQQLISNMAKAHHAEPWDFYPRNTTTRGESTIYRFKLVFHFPFGLSTSVACCKRASEHRFACWTTKDSAIYGLFVWRDPDEWRVPLSTRFKFIGSANLTPTDSFPNQSVSVRD